MPTTGNAAVQKYAAKSRRDRARIINTMADEGCNAEQIAQVLGISTRAVHYAAERIGLSIGRRGGTRRIGSYVSTIRFTVIDELARDACISRSAMIKRLIDAAAPDVPSAKRFLGKLAR